MPKGFGGDAGNDGQWGDMGMFYPMWQQFMANMARNAQIGQNASWLPQGTNPGPQLGGQILGSGAAGFANNMQNAMGQMAQLNARNQDATVQNNAIKAQVAAPALTEAIRQQGSAARTGTLASLLAGEAGSLGRGADYASRIGQGLGNTLGFLG